ncbi:uncharacterized protein LOC113338595 [Papaver somniferum]|uniref:uncharacterized protein LOC113338595 n=1 Tax=Papaver somniferum TaxID=3469 RepID=UPI000E6F47C8|nr:uncharacterized protein LOC113338595 [Papaver somniferum]
MFVAMLIFCEVTDPKRLWEENWSLLSEGIEKQERKKRRNLHLDLDEAEFKNLTLIDIEEIMGRNSRTLKEFPSIPFLNKEKQYAYKNKLIDEELAYDTEKLRNEHIRLKNGLNTVQREIFDVVRQSIKKGDGGLFFVYGSGESKVVLAVASSGIASLLLPGGRTAHSRLKIPITLEDNSTCDISHGTQLAGLIKKAEIVIWDEAPMIHRHAFEALERTVKDLMNERKDKTKEKLFGVKTLLFGGDFRQILPVIRGGSRENIIDASISRSRLWKHFHVFELSKNMWLLHGNCNSAEKQSISEFSKWILDLGDGKLPAKAIEGEDDKPTWIKIPDDLLIESGENPIKIIVQAIYPGLLDKIEDWDYLRKRCILTPKNDIVDQINDYVVSMHPGKDHVFLSFDSISPQSYDFENAELLYNQEYLNSQKLSGLPNHVLRLKLNVPVMLTRNKNTRAGLCNGKTLIVTRIMARTIQVKIITGSAAGKSAVVSRIVIQPTETHLPFILRRVQFPIKVCFSMTINKSQGQSIDNVGIYLPNPIFYHGQLYVAVSKKTSRSGLKIKIDKTKDIVPEGYTQNVVYREIFTNLHQKHKTHQIQEISSDRSHLEGDQEIDEEMTPLIEDSGDEFSAFNNRMIEDSGDEFSAFNNIVIEDSGSEKGDQESDEEMALFVEDSDDEY